MRRLTAPRWSNIETVDDDLGRSAAGGGVRAGFERMVAEVCLGKVGAVAAREVSRFARNSRDWQQLLEVCRVVDTVLIDQETIYAPRHSNDRLLLGLKGNLNKYQELEQVCQPRPLRAKRDASIASTAPALPLSIATSRRSKPFRALPPPERPRSSSMTTTFCDPRASARPFSAYWRRRLSGLCAN
jgi:Resolvase, N terminal domain